MKQRFSSLDIKVIAQELSQSLPSLRVSNIYDLSSRIFLFKFAKPNHREQLIIDAGYRCHLTSFARTTAGTPSAFVTRLRKFLKSRRVTAVSQVGTDRILEIQLSDGQYRLFLEFYASGNIILTDHELKVLALFRIVNEGAEHEQVRPGSTYNLSERQNINGVPPLTNERVKTGLQRFLDRQTDNAGAQQNQKKRGGKKSEDLLRKALANCINEYPPMLLEHSLQVSGFDTKVSPEDVVKDDALVSSVVEALKVATNVMDGIMKADTIKGYILGKPNPGSTKTQAEVIPSAAVMYNDFHPFKPKQFQDDPNITILEFEGYNRTVDEFFSSIEGQKLESKLQEKEEAAKKKMENAKQVQENRIGGLQAVQEANVRKAQAIEANLERVEEATGAINGLIAQGMDWYEIDRLIELEQARHNPVAEIIKLPLKLQENTATLLLAEWSFEAEEDDNDLTESEPSDSEDEKDPVKSEKKGADTKQSKSEDKRLVIDIDLALSAWSNAREYYDQKKTAAAKEEKTVQASTKALRSAQQKIDADLKRALKQEKQVLRPVRQQLWFEKFIYFISSDGYLVLGGKDGQQADLLYKRHLKKGDVYISADLNGAASVIIKNNPATPDAPIPPSTLSQAGNLSVATSNAWDSKAVMSAWWVSADQVSKFASTGDFLSVGNFFIKGEKNFLPPAQLLLGFAVLFQISEASKANHNKHRVQGENSITRQEQQASNDNTDAEDSRANAGSEAQEDNASLDGEDYDDAGSETHSEQENDDSEFLQSYSNPLQPQSAADEPESRNEVATNGFRDAIVQEDANQETNDDIATANAEEPDADDVASNGGEEDEEDDADDSQSVAQSTTTASSKTQQDASKQNLPVRGKRGKRKKMQQKYANQDEEDREAAMRLLGSRAGQEKVEEEARAKKAREEEAAAQKERRRQQHLKKQAEGRAVEEKRLAAEQGAGEHGDGEDDEGDENGASLVVDLDALVGTPLPGDEILEAIPVCAPWTALGRYKFKAKLQPGTQKKGKAVREILSRWTVDEKDKKKVDDRSEDVERIWPREMELIKGWREAEILNIVPVSKVRVMMSGGLSGKDGKGGQSKGGKQGRGGKGSKKQR